MVGVIESFTDAFRDGYVSFISKFSPSVVQGINVFVVAIAISLLALFIWYFYKTLSERNIIGLNLNQYNKTEHPGVNKFLAIILYVLEYIVIMPFLITLWFAALSIFILFIAPKRTISEVLFVSAVLIASIRILAYAQGEISRDIAKLFPLITLSLFFLDPQGIDLGNNIAKFSEIPQLFGNIFSFLVVVFVIEIVLRVLYAVKHYAIHSENPFIYNK